MDLFVIDILLIIMTILTISLSIFNYKSSDLLTLEHLSQLGSNISLLYGNNSDSSADISGLFGNLSAPWASLVTKVCNNGADWRVKIFYVSVKLFQKYIFLQILRCILIHILLNVLIWKLLKFCIIAQNFSLLSQGIKYT